MNLTTFIGKLLLISSIVFQAFLLYYGKRHGDQFNKNLNSALTHCYSLTSIRQPLMQYMRLTITGLLGSSVFMLFMNKWTLKLPTLVGLLLLLWVQHHDICHKLSTPALSLQILDNTALWHSLGIIGAILYLMDTECDTSKRSTGVEASESLGKATEDSSEQNKVLYPNEGKRRQKRN